MEEEPVPEYILDNMMGQAWQNSCNQGASSLEAKHPTEATWEFLYDLQKKFPTCTLEDKSKHMSEAHVMTTTSAVQE